MRRQRLTAVLVGLGALGVCGVLVFCYRVELFILPRLWQEVLRLHDLRGREKEERWQAADRELTRVADALVRLQRLEFTGGSLYGVQPVRTDEGRQAFVLVYRGGEPPVCEDPEVLDAGVHFVAVDARGRLIGSDFQAPPWPNAICAGQAYRALSEADESPGIIAVSGDPGCLLSVDARGVVPRGAVIQYSYPAPPDGSAPFVSSGNCAAVRRWLASIPDPPPTTEEASRLLRSSRVGDLFRALHALERLGPAAAHLARPLLSHPDPDLRARAAAVLGNDESLWAALVPLTLDPAPQVRTAARFAILRAPDVDAARTAFFDLLRERNDFVQHTDFDHQRLIGPEAAAVMLEGIEETGHAPERFVKALRAPDLQALVIRLEGLWVHPSDNVLRMFGVMTALVPWLVRAESPQLDQLLVDWIQSECPGSRWSSGLADDIMRGLLERPSPLEAEDAVRTLLHCTADRFVDGIPLSAYLLLIHWQVPGAAERLLARPCEPGTDCLSDLLNNETQDYRVPPSLRATLEALALKQRDR